MKSKNKNLLVLDFAKCTIPEPFESRVSSDNNFVHWGIDNLYPSFLLSLYQDSEIHGGIVKQKANYVIGDGLAVGGQKIELNVNPSDSIDEFLQKVVLDYILFGGFAAEINFNSKGEIVELNHVPLHRLRMNKTKEKFWYYDDWQYRTSTSNIIYERYSNTAKQDGKSKLFYFDSYSPSKNLVYPTPEYINCLTTIKADVELKSYTLNSIVNSFSPTNIITFFNGENVSEETKAETLEKLEENFTGANGKRFMIDFQNSNGKSAEINQLSIPDFDKLLALTNDQTRDRILTGHFITNPGLFGIKTAGQLGGNQELKTAYQLFSNSYILGARNQLKSALNYLFKNFNDIQGEVHFIENSQLFRTELSESVMTRIYTVNELRKLCNLPAIENGDRLLDEQVQKVTIQPPTNSTPGPGVESPNTPSLEESDIQKKKSQRKLSEDDFDLIKHLGTSIDDFELLEEYNAFQKFNLSSDIAAYIVENDITNLTIKEIVDVLKHDGIKATEKTLHDTINKMKESGLIAVEDGEDGGGRINIKPQPLPDIPDTDGVFVMYKYVKRPSVKGNTLIETSRGFCVKIIENDKLYSREDIQEMTRIFGYDIYAHTGGFYHNPDTGKTTNYCRHKWQAIRVKRRIS